MSAAKTLARITHVALPVEVVADIDKLVGKEGQRAFLTELVQREVKLRRQREALREGIGGWNSEEEPELANGAEAGTRQIQAVDDRRFEDLAMALRAFAVFELGLEAGLGVLERRREEK